MKILRRNFSKSEGPLSKVVYDGTTKLDVSFDPRNGSYQVNNAHGHNGLQKGDIIVATTTKEALMNPQLSMSEFKEHIRIVAEKGHQGS